MDEFLHVCRYKHLNEEHGRLFLSYANVRLGMNLQHRPDRLSPLTHLREASYYLSTVV